jgi:hypothetical protein
MSHFTVIYYLQKAKVPQQYHNGIEYIHFTVIYYLEKTNVSQQYHNGIEFIYNTWTLHSAYQGSGTRHNTNKVTLYKYNTNTKT